MRLMENKCAGKKKYKVVLKTSRGHAHREAEQEKALATEITPASTVQDSKLPQR